MNEFLYWFVRAKGILNLFPEIFDLNPEGDREGGRRSGRKVHNIVDNFKECNQRTE